jgi:protein associated with RNAse G/E
MELTLKELNQIYYGLHVTITHQSEHKLLDVDEINKLIDKVRDEIDLKIYESES